MSCNFQQRPVTINDRSSLLPLGDPTWQVVNEYDPLWPNDYAKVVQGSILFSLVLASNMTFLVTDMRDSKRSAPSEDDHTSSKRRYADNARDKARERFNRSESSTSGFGRRPRGEDDYSDEEDSPRRSASGRRSTGCKSLKLLQRVF